MRRMLLSFFMVLMSSSVFGQQATDSLEWCFPVLNNGKYDDSVVYLPTAQYPRDYSVSKNGQALYIMNGVFTQLKKYGNGQTTFEAEAVYLPQRNDGTKDVMQSQEFLLVKDQSNNFPYRLFKETKGHKQLACKINM